MSANNRPISGAVQSSDSCIPAFEEWTAFVSINTTFIKLVQFKVEILDYYVTGVV